jgi:hypothetical protein
MTDRELVSRLIMLVITSQLSVKDAVLKFPKDTDDINIKTAYHALLHYEADEDFRATDYEFREEQDNYLTMISELLANNKELPKNIIKSYESYFPEVELPKSKTILNFLISLSKFLNVKTEKRSNK